jgi:hypothetical protein
MIIRFLFTLLAAVLLVGAPELRVAAAAPQSSAGEEIVIKVKGEGTDPSAAKTDATREALRQAVGMFVDAQTVVKDDQIISDKILSATNALVLGSKVVSGPKRRADGLYEVECEVKIRRHQLVSAIGSAGIAMTGAIDGDAAKRVSEINFKNEQEALELLNGRLSNLWSKLAIARMIDDKGAPLGDGELPTVVQRGGGTVIVCANLQVYFHLEAYYTKFAPDFKRLLAAIAKGTAPIERSANRPFWRGQSPCPYRTRFGRLPVYPHLAEREPEQQPEGFEQSDRIVWVSDGRDESAMNEHFTGYKLPTNLFKAIKEAESAVTGGRIRIELVGEADRVIHARVVDLREFDAAMASAQPTDDETFRGQTIEIDGVDFADFEGWLIRSGHSSSLVAFSPTFLISPYIESNGWAMDASTHTAISDAVELRVEIAMPSADLAAVKGYRLTAIEGRPRP